MKSSALDFEEMARAGASNEQILRDVAEIDLGISSRKRNHS